MRTFSEKSKLLVTCAKGLAPLLVGELKTLGFPVEVEKTLGVFSRGSLDDTILLNLKLRTGFRVLYHLLDFSADSPADLYLHIRKIEWEKWLPLDGYFSVTSAVFTESINDTRYANLKCKDAIVDRFQDVCGQRPNSGSDRNKAVIFLYWRDRFCSVFLDTSGDSLSKRGYRKIPGVAPMQETLAAGVVLASAWRGQGHFVNPMCGSGTIAIEAALIALDKSPGLLRNNFGFMHLNGYDKSQYLKIRKDIRSKVKNTAECRIVVSDIDRRAVSAAEKNATTAGVNRFLEFEVCDFKNTEIPTGEGVVFLNPPYGKRMGQLQDLEKTYRDIGDFFKQKCMGYRGYIFTGNPQLQKKVGLRTKRRMIFYNSKIECRLLEYELYEGSRKRKDE